MAGWRRTQGLVKGYLSHEKRTLVLSNTDPFPAVHLIPSW